MVNAKNILSILTPYLNAKDGHGLMLTLPPSIDGCTSEYSNYYKLEHTKNLNILKCFIDVFTDICMSYLVH